MINDHSDDSRRSESIGFHSRISSQWYFHLRSLFRRFFEDLFSSYIYLIFARGTPSVNTILSLFFPSFLALRSTMFEFSFLNKQIYLFIFSLLRGSLNVSLICSIQRYFVAIYCLKISAYFKYFLISNTFSSFRTTPK